ITAGQISLFGGVSVALELQPAGANRHWTFYEGKPQAAGVEDLKFTWEPARFGWVYPLGRAYLLSSDERYPAAFWNYLDVFCQANPPNLGPNWSSAQEVALRLLALLFAASAFKQSPLSSPARCSQLAGVIAAHAQRLPLTLSYARAQNNNHLISEALGLYCAGAALAEHPQAASWRKTGWRWLNRALQNQIQPSGIYTQHSMNYHRLMLQAALQALLPGQPFPPLTMRRLASAATWLLAQIDPTSGHAPNLGSNDGAHILPLASGGFADYRAVGQAAARAFLNQPAFPPGPWDELGLWLGQNLTSQQRIPPLPPCRSVHRLGDPTSWATLRAVHFRQRPAHADQLHVDLWWKGENIARDSGTYRYTAPLPWDNALAQTAVHNTITVNHQNQMLRAGRFLWLDWAQAKLFSPPNIQTETLAAQHNGYAHLGVIHRRVLKRVDPRHWQIADDLRSTTNPRLDISRGKLYPFTIHWLLPDWPWNLDDSTLTLDHPAGGKVRLTLSPSLPEPSS
ncbi:MAG: alginate lyase family protein, partial [Anaerolineaceae bacterium]|nr:alginate lyase family protein [Anaerolineaceae bacterium]